LFEAFLAFEQATPGHLAGLAVGYIARDAIRDFAIAPDAVRFTALLREANCLEDRLRLLLGHLGDVEEAKRDGRCRGMFMMRITLRCVRNASFVVLLSNKSKSKRIVCDASSIIWSAFCGKME
jgi:hypothetical protein